MLFIVKFWGSGDLDISKSTLLVNNFAVILCSFILIAIKPVEDCFAIFNRLGTKRSYSIFQYPIEESATQDQYQRMLRDQLGFD